MPPIQRSSHATLTPTNTFQHQKCSAEWEAAQLGDFSTELRPSRAIIPSFCGQTKSSVVICWKITHHNVKMEKMIVTGMISRGITLYLSSPPFLVSILCITSRAMIARVHL